MEGGCGQQETWWRSRSSLRHRRPVGACGQPAAVSAVGKAGTWLVVFVLLAAPSPNAQARAAPFLLFFTCGGRSPCSAFAFLPHAIPLPRPSRSTRLFDVLLQVRAKRKRMSRKGEGVVKRGLREDGPAHPRHRQERPAEGVRGWGRRGPGGGHSPAGGKGIWRSSWLGAEGTSGRSLTSSASSCRCLNNCPHGLIHFLRLWCWM